MRKIVFLVMLLASGCASVQQANVADLPPWSQVVEISMQKDQIYTRSRAWFVQYYVSAKSVLQMEDSQNGILMGVGATNFIYMGMVNEWLEYVLKIEAKDGKYRISMDRLCVTGTNAQGEWRRCSPNIYQAEADAIKAAWDNIIADHKKSLLQGAASDF